MTPEIWIGLAALVGYGLFVWIILAYADASNGERLDTYFGNAIFFTTPLSTIAALALLTWRPAFVTYIGIDPDDAVLYAIAITPIAGAIGAVADAVAWLSRKLS